MVGKQSRQPTSPSLFSPSQRPPSKLPKFLQKQVNRDRMKSSTDPDGPTGSTSTLGSISGSSGSGSAEAAVPVTVYKGRKSSKFLGLKDRDEKSRRSSEVAREGSQAQGPIRDVGVDEAPIIVEPVAIPRPRTRSERPAVSAPDTSSSSLYASTSSASRIGDLPTRLSGWFAHTFSASTTDLSSLLVQSSLGSGSPKGKSSGAAALLNAAKHGKGHLDKAMRYLLDSDAMPDKCTDTIWLLGVQHAGYEPPSPMTQQSFYAQQVSGHRAPATSPPLRSSTSSSTSGGSYAESTTPSSPKSSANPASHWPPAFYLDFTSRIWLSYRSHFPPIRDMHLEDLYTGTSTAADTKSRPWNWIADKSWTSDSGWGCMLRTGQSLLANALIHMHLGRDWRRPAYPVYTANYATYVRILTWFFDTPGPEAPFSVHRMALAGKDLGTDVGQWFGPSTAAGAIKTLVNLFPEAGIGVSIATDGVLFQTDVYAASHGASEEGWSPGRRRPVTGWGHEPVLLLLGIRLGIDGVNPIYHETIKLLYTFPQSVGIAGGRPSSSYYFVGSQTDTLFYLDPHHTRPAIALRSLPSTEREGVRAQTQTQGRARAPTSPASTRTSSTVSHHAPLSPSPLQHSASGSLSAEWSGRAGGVGRRWRSASGSGTGPREGTASQPDTREFGMRSNHVIGRGDTNGNGNDGAAFSDVASTKYELREGATASSGLDMNQVHYVTSYSAAELRTFHCDRVRKMPMSGLDPSMLIGFVCRDEGDWQDFRRRVAKLPRMIFSVQDEPPNWPSDSDDNMGLESISEPDDLDSDDDGDHKEVDALLGSVLGADHEATTGVNEIEGITAKSNSEPVAGIEDEMEDEWVDPQGSSYSSSSSCRSSSASSSVNRHKKDRSKPIHYPFPLTSPAVPESYSYINSTAMPAGAGVDLGVEGLPVQRMNTGRARDGGRTQSGGVRGVPEEP